jgi:hypothetical protein
MVRLVERFLEQSALEQSREQPFALWVSFMEPHSPYDFPIEDRNHFDPKRFTPPRVGPEDAWQIPIIFRDLSDDEKRGIARFCELLKKHGLGPVYEPKFVS